MKTDKIIKTKEYILNEDLNESDNAEGYAIDLINKAKNKLIKEGSKSLDKDNIKKTEKRLKQISENAKRTAGAIKTTAKVIIKVSKSLIDLASKLISYIVSSGSIAVIVVVIIIIVSSLLMIISPLIFDEKVDEDYITKSEMEEEISSAFNEKIDRILEENIYDDYRIYGEPENTEKFANRYIANLIYNDKKYDGVIKYSDIIDAINLYLKENEMVVRIEENIAFDRILVEDEDGNISYEEFSSSFIKLNIYIKNNEKEHDPIDWIMLFVFYV